MAEQRIPLDALPACAAVAGTGQRQITHFGFNGELCELLTGHYLLGNGYRAFNPVLMRFNSADSVSPFGSGGINTYAAFRGAPTTYQDVDGHTPFPVTMTLLRAASKFKEGIGSVKKLRQAVAIDPIVKNAKKLTNEIPGDYPAYLSAFKARSDLGGLNMRVVTHKNNFELGGDVKFIFTDKAELIIGNAQQNAFAHPLLTYLASKDSRVISAGYLKPQKGMVGINAHTGHYHKSAAGLDTLKPVMNYIRRLGGGVRIVR